MFKKVSAFFFLLILVGLTFPVYGTNHYVDKNANGSNNGTSWTNAWTSFSSINWGTIQPGDNIYISGGTDSTVYNESMTIGKSGAAGNLITVRNGLDAGHNGKVVIDRNYASGNSGAIEIWNQKYLRVAGITIRKVVGSGIYLRGQSTNALKNVYVDSCDISDFRGQGGVYVSGYGNSGNARDYVDSVFIRYNTITTLTYGNYQTDCIYVQYQKSAFVVGNVIHQRNTYNPSQHCDGVQSSDAVNLVVADNYIDLINDNGEANQPDQGIIIGRMTGVVEVYNNIVYTPYLDGYSNSVLVGMASTGTWDIYGNTIVSYTNSNLMKFDLPTSGYVKNNIFYSQRSSAAVIYPSGLAASHIDNNLYYYTTGNTVVSNRGTLSQMRAAGAEINGMNTNPSFINPSGNWRLDPGSSAINAGYTLGNPYNVDMVGVPRPQGSGYDMGAYEYVAGGGNLPPSQPSNPNPVNAAINQPVSLTLTWSCSDPNGDPLTYDVYFGTSSNPSLVSGNQSSASYNPGQLNNSATYYWKIIAKDNHGNSTSGPVWNFATITGIINNPPNQPSNPNPVNAAINQPISLTLTWSCSDPDGDPLTYDIYFGTSSNPSLVSGNQSNASYNPGQLNNSTTYYWKIVAKDNQDSSTTGPVWNFATDALVNNPPNQPSNPNPANGAVNQLTSLTLTWTCSDPEGDPLTYDVYFGTSNNPSLVSGNQSSASYNPGQLSNSTTYHWKIIAKDNYGNSTSGSVWNFTTEAVGDITPPQLVSAALTGISSLLVTFSEEMDQASIANRNNYSINHGITVNSVLVQPGNTRAILKTSSHSRKVIYTLTVNNVKDAAGNPIDPQHNTASYYIKNRIRFSVDQANAQWLQDFKPGNTIDGITDTTSESRWQGVLSFPDSIVFDLGERDSVDETQFSFYKWDQGVVYHYSVTASSDGVHWAELVSNQMSFSQEWTIDDFTPLYARYIKLSILNCNQEQYAGLWEAQILGPDETTGVEKDQKIPADFSLEQNYPNPFNPATTIKFSVPSGQNVKIDVYNSIGQFVKELVNQFYTSGSYSITFNAVDLPSGVYIYRLEATPGGGQAGTFNVSRKMILMK